MLALSSALRYKVDTHTFFSLSCFMNSVTIPTGRSLAGLALTIEVIKLKFKKGRRGSRLKNFNHTVFKWKEGGIGLKYSREVFFMH